MSSAEAKTRVAFIEAAEALKDTMRSGFTAQGRSEDTASHTWRLCLWLVVFADRLEGVDLAHALRMAVIHDLGEAISGDIPATEQVGPKAAEERADFASLLSGLPDEQQADLLALWDEYETGESPAAVAVKGFDKLETILQHTQGHNPEDFDYGFNLGYRREATERTALLRLLRGIVDEKTRARMR